jgi:hypothetical protein
MIEICIIAKNEEKTLRHKHLDYSTDIKINRDDPKLIKYIEDIAQDFGEAIDDIIIKIKFIW